jgi:hypothetical protein
MSKHPRYLPPSMKHLLAAENFYVLLNQEYVHMNISVTPTDQTLSTPLAAVNKSGGMRKSSDCADHHVLIENDPSPTQQSPHHSSLLSVGIGPSTRNRDPGFSKRKTSEDRPLIGPIAKWSLRCRCTQREVSRRF